jgi:hypothetical protein
MSALDFVFGKVAAAAIAGGTGGNAPSELFLINNRREPGTKENFERELTM